MTNETSNTDSNEEILFPPLSDLFNELSEIALSIAEANPLELERTDENKRQVMHRFLGLFDQMNDLATKVDATDGFTAAERMDNESALVTVLTYGKMLGKWLFD